MYLIATVYKKQENYYTFTKKKQEYLNKIQNTFTKIKQIKFTDISIYLNYHLSYVQYNKLIERATF